MDSAIITWNLANKETSYLDIDEEYIRKSLGRRKVATVFRDKRASSFVYMIDSIIIARGVSCTIRLSKEIKLKHDDGKDPERTNQIPDFVMGFRVKELGLSECNFIYKSPLKGEQAYLLIPFACWTPGLLQLGQIITDLRKPHSSITLPLLPLPNSSTTIKENSRIDLSSSYKLDSNLFAKYLSIIETQSDGCSSSSFARKWHIKELETTSMDLTHDYVKQSIIRPDTQEYIRRKMICNAVYMITGIEIARGASYTSDESSEKGNKEVHPCSLIPEFIWAIRVRIVKLNIQKGSVAVFDDDDDKLVTAKGAIYIELEREDMGIELVPKGFRSNITEDEVGGGEQCFLVDVGWVDRIEM
ncbi:hypothetical protein BDV96DRAFT_653818 [Lophiotrema nucula]|uniref:Uncharacterized protein n=1 Tax=Lophiotrema nucula TaxID=690887 RepID=A0A6A5YMC8_9PLEO|nr:hypothetical protein BDV96DRAFT_653818 [Lophiotrema nucula]